MVALPSGRGGWGEFHKRQKARVVPKLEIPPLSDFGGRTRKNFFNELGDERGGGGGGKLNCYNSDRERGGNG